MNRDYAPLTAHPLKPGSDFARPTQKLPERVTLEDPAINVMTDLRAVSVVTVHSETPVDKANAKMMHHGVRTLLVLGDTDKVVGILTATDILGERPIRFLKNHGGAHADIRVHDIMTPHRDLEVLMLSDVMGAKAGHILATLKAAGRQHALVASENADKTHTVCGIFSATQIARQLGIQVQITEVARTFAQIEEALADSHVLI